jgi:cytochrome d ubiquinol oxidase subunit I
MHTPQGFEIVDNVVIPVNWLQVIFNPSFPYRLAHMTVAAFLATAAFVGAAAAWHLLRGNDNDRVRTMLSMAMWMLLLVAPVQVLIGDLHGLNTLQHQPAKIAAIEGHWENKPDESIPLILFGWPDMKQETTRYKVEIPRLGSYILTRDWNGQFPGLKEFAAEDRPNSTVVFWSFRIMVGLGMLMLLLGAWGAWLRWRGLLYGQRHFLHFATWMGPSGLLAILAGWYTTEIGRQPWIVQGVMRTKDAVSGHSVLTMSVTLLVFVVAYLIVFGIGARYMLRLVGEGPQLAPNEPPDADSRPHHRPARPLSAAPDHVGTPGSPTSGQGG